MARIPSVDLSHCTDCEGCLELCADVFKRNEAGTIEVTDLSVYPEACVEEAIACCPAQCISWEDPD